MWKKTTAQTPKGPAFPLAPVPKHTRRIQKTIYSTAHRKRARSAAHLVSEGDHRADPVHAQVYRHDDLVQIKHAGGGLALALQPRGARPAGHGLVLVLARVSESQQQSTPLVHPHSGSSAARGGCSGPRACTGTRLGL